MRTDNRTYITHINQQKLQLEDTARIRIMPCIHSTSAGKHIIYKTRTKAPTLNLFHPFLQKLLNVLKRALLQRVTTQIQKILGKATNKCSECSNHSSNSQGSKFHFLRIVHIQPSFCNRLIMDGKLVLPTCELLPCTVWICNFPSF